MTLHNFSHCSRTVLRFGLFLCLNLTLLFFASHFLFELFESHCVLTSLCALCEILLFRLSQFLLLLPHTFRLFLLALLQVRKDLSTATDFFHESRNTPIVFCFALFGNRLLLLPLLCLQCFHFLFESFEERFLLSHSVLQKFQILSADALRLSFDSAQFVATVSQNRIRIFDFLFQLRSRFADFAFIFNALFCCLTALDGRFELCDVRTQFLLFAAHFGDRQFVLFDFLQQRFDFL